MKLQDICEGRLKAPTKNKPASAALSGSARFIIKQITKHLAKQNKPVTPDNITQQIKLLGSEEDGGWSDVVKDHAIKLAHEQE